VSGTAVYIRLVDPRHCDSLRAPGLERLLAQASPPHASTDWRRDAFNIIAGTAAIPSVAAVALQAALPAAPRALAGSWVCVATPVHLVAGMTNVTLPGHCILQLRAAESAL